MEPNLDHLTDALRRAGAHFAYVFGSRARGAATEASDLDLAAFFGRTDVDPLAVDGVDFVRVDLVLLDRAPLELAGRVALTGDHARFRNVLVHLYADVDEARAIDRLGRLDELERYVAAVAELI